MLVNLLDYEKVVLTCFHLYGAEITDELAQYERLFFFNSLIFSILRNPVFTPYVGALCNYT